MKHTIAPTVAVALLGGALVGSSGVPQPSDSAVLYAKSCVGCHVPPDIAFKADQAWLGQISGTA